MKGFFVLIAVLAVLASCRSSRTISKAVGRSKDTTVKAVVVPADTPKVDTTQLIREVLSQVAANRINFTTFSAKLDVDYKGSDGKNHNINGNIKMYRDSAVWVSLSATLLSIEGVRLLITKDSVKLLNKLEKTYAARGISFLQEATSLPLNLYTVQDLIIGNPVYLDSNVTRYSRGNGTVALLSLGDLFKNLATFTEPGAQIVHSKLTDADPFRNRTADLTYAEYETKTGRPFSTKRQVIVSERSRLEVKLDFKNYSFDEEVSFPFKVPKNYSRL